MTLDITGRIPNTFPIAHWLHRYVLANAPTTAACIFSTNSKQAVSIDAHYRGDTQPQYNMHGWHDWSKSITIYQHQWIGTADWYRIQFKKTIQLVIDNLGVPSWLHFKNSLLMTLNVYWIVSGVSKLVTMPSIILIWLPILFEPTVTSFYQEISDISDRDCRR